MRLRVAGVFAVLLILVVGFVTPPNAEARGRAGLLVTVYNFPSTYGWSDWEESSPWTRSRSLRRPCLTTTFDQIFQDWGSGSVGRRCNEDDFLVRYQGFIRVPTTGTYTFYTSTDDGFWLQIGRSVVIDDWEDQDANEWNEVGVISLVANRRYALDAWLYENSGDAEAALFYSVGGGEPSVVPSSWFSHR
jgi:hypothetical protein